MMLSFLAGIGISVVAAAPLILWARSMGRKVYANSRIRGMKAKLKKARSFQAATREEYEMKIEEYFDEGFEKLQSFSGIKEFWKAYSIKDEHDDLKALLYAAGTGKNPVLKTKKYDKYIGYQSAKDIMMDLPIDFDFNKLEEYGILYAEYELDKIYFKRLKSTKMLPEYYSLLRYNYLLAQKLRLDLKENELIELLALNEREEEILKRDINLELKEISRDPKIRKMVLAGEPKEKIFGYYFDVSLSEFSEKQARLKNFSSYAEVSLFNLLQKSSAKAKRGWS